MSELFKSLLAPYIQGLVDQKRSIGYPYDTSEDHLRKFDGYCLCCFPTVPTLTHDMAMEWASLRPKEHPNGLLRRITPIRQLGKYMRSIGMDAYVLPPKIPGKQTRYTPHIYTRQELGTFFGALDACRKSPFSPGRYLVIPVFFRVLYCCGLRSSEARLLAREDVNLAAGTLLVRESKGHKDRIVHMSDDVAALCADYDAKIQRQYPNREAFFPNQQGSFYNSGMPGYWFHDFWDKLPKAKNHSGNAPRVHDFRHTFAVNRLSQWVCEGKDVNAYLPYLSMYLGHQNFADTDYYLHLTPEFFPVLKEKSKTIFGDIVPEAIYEQEI